MIERIRREQEGSEALGFDDGVAFNSDGTATAHHAVDRVPEKHYTGHIERADFDQLSSVLEAEGFFELDDRYGEGWRGIVTSASRSGETKVVRVSDRSLAPPNLITIWEAIASAREKVNWVESS